MRVKNINGTSDNICSCGSWLEHWKKFSKPHALQQILMNCSVESCDSRAEVGAHVQKDDSFDNKWYIVPLCEMHNLLRGETLDLDDIVELVSANKSETCG